MSKIQNLSSLKRLKTNNNYIKFQTTIYSYVSRRMAFNIQDCNKNINDAGEEILSNKGNIINIFDLYVMQ